MSQEQTFDMVGRDAGSPEYNNNDQELNIEEADHIQQDTFHGAQVDAQQETALVLADEANVVQEVAGQEPLEDTDDLSSWFASWDQAESGIEHAADDDHEAVSAAIDEDANESGTEAAVVPYQMAEDRQLYGSSDGPATASTSMQHWARDLNYWLANSYYAQQFHDGPPDCAFEAFHDGEDIEFCHPGRSRLGRKFWGVNSESYWADKHCTTEKYQKGNTGRGSSLRVEVAQVPEPLVDLSLPHINLSPPASAPLPRPSCWDDDEENDNAELTEFIRRHSTGNMPDPVPEPLCQTEDAGTTESPSESARLIDADGDIEMAGTNPFAPSGGNEAGERPVSRHGLVADDDAATNGQEINETDDRKLSSDGPVSPTPSNASSVDSLTGMSQSKGYQHCQDYYADEHPSLGKSRALLKYREAGDGAVDRLPEAPKKDRLELLSARLHGYRKQRDEARAYAEELEARLTATKAKLADSEAQADGWWHEVEDFRKLAEASNENCEAAVLAKGKAEARLAKDQASFRELAAERHALQIALEEQQMEVERQQSNLRDRQDELDAAQEEVQELLEINYELRQRHAETADAQTQTQQTNAEQGTQPTQTQNETTDTRPQTTDAQSQTEQTGNDRGTQTDFNDLSSPSTSSSDSGSGSDTDSDSDSDSDSDDDDPLLPDDFVRWHPVRIDEIAERIAEWVNATHAREDRHNPMTVMTAQVREILGDGTTSFRSLHDQLRQLGFMSRHDRFAQFIEELTRDVQGTTSLEAMDTARDYESDEHPRQRLLEELDQHIRRFQGGQANYELIRDNCNLRDLMSSLRKELEECHGHGRQLQMELWEKTALVHEILARSNSDGEANEEKSQSELKDLEKRLAECHEHGQKLEEELKEKTELLNDVLVRLESSGDGGEDNGQKKLAEVTKQLAGCQEHGRQLAKELEETKEMVENIGNEVARCTEAGEQEDKGLKHAIKQFIQSEKQNKRLQQELEKTRRALEELTQQMASDNEGDLQADQDQLNELKGQLQQCHEHGEQLAAERDSLKDDIEKLNNFLAAAEGDNLDLKDQVNHLEATRLSLEDDCSRLTQTLEQIQVSNSLKDAAEQEDEHQKSDDGSVRRSGSDNEPIQRRGSGGESDEIAKLKETRTRHLAMLAVARETIEDLQAQVAQGINRFPMAVLASRTEDETADDVADEPSTDSQETPTSHYQRPGRWNASELRIMRTEAYKNTSKALKQKREEEAKLRKEERELRQEVYHKLTGSTQIPHMTREDRMEALQRLITVV